jgi:hypothetical protein
MNESSGRSIDPRQLVGQPRPPSSDQPSEGWLATLKRIGIVVGCISGVVGCIGGVLGGTKTSLDLHKQFIAAPRIVLSLGPDLLMRWNKDGKILSLVCKVKLQNDGDAHGEADIPDAMFRYRRPNGQLKDIPLTVRMAEGQYIANRALSIKADRVMELSLTGSATLTEEQMNEVKFGQKFEFSFEFKHPDPMRQSYCAWLGKNLFPDINKRGEAIFTDNDESCFVSE